MGTQTADPAAAVAATAPLAERLFRRADFRGGIPVAMADGGEWFLPCPRVRFLPDHTPMGVRIKSDLTTDYDEALNAYHAVRTNSLEDVSLHLIMTSQLRLAEALLRVNYDLTLEQVQTLIQFTYKADEADPLRDAIIAIATGESEAAPRSFTDGPGSL